MKPTPKLTHALAELTLTMHALRTDGIDTPACRMDAAAAFVLAACAQLDSRGVLRRFMQAPRPRRAVSEPHGAERDWLANLADGEGRAG